MIPVRSDRKTARARGAPLLAALSQGAGAWAIGHLIWKFCSESKSAMANLFATLLDRGAVARFHSDRSQIGNQVIKKTAWFFLHYHVGRIVEPHEFLCGRMNALEPLISNRMRGCVIVTTLKKEDWALERNQILIVQFFRGAQKMSQGVQTTFINQV